MARTSLLELFDQEEDTLKNKYLTFEIGKECYGIEIENVIEIIGIQLITEVPELPKYIRGIINLRGKIIPVMDVRLRFKKTFKEYNERTCVVIAIIKNFTLGLIVDGVYEVIYIPDSDIAPPPEINSFSSRYIKGIGKVKDDVKLILDCDRFLKKDEIEYLETV